MTKPTGSATKVQPTPKNDEGAPGDASATGGESTSYNYGPCRNRTYNLLVAPSYKKRRAIACSIGRTGDRAAEPPAESAPDRQEGATKVQPLGTTSTMPIENEALRVLAIDLAGVPNDCWRFFATLFTAPPTRRVRETLGQNLGVVESTLMSRFFRAGLPAPKDYLDGAFLIRVAGLYETIQRPSWARVANEMELSSPQSLERSIKRLTGVTATPWIEHTTARAELERFRRELVLPHLATLTRFHPINGNPAPASMAGAA